MVNVQRNNQKLELKIMSSVFSDKKKRFFQKSKNKYKK